MANIDQIDFQANNNQKFIVEELIESELKEVVGGAQSIVSQQVTQSITDGNQTITQNDSVTDENNSDKKSFPKWFFKGKDFVNVKLGNGIKITVNI